MFTSSLLPVAVLARNFIQKDPGIIVGPITVVLGAIVNYIFNIVSMVSEANSLGFAIIFLTIITRVLMMPLAMHQQKSMMNMQNLQPEIARIKKKYPNSGDAEAQKKMNVEIQALYSKHKINPLMGCLPLVIQMPIFFALTYIMQQSYKFIDTIGQVYYAADNSLAKILQAMPGFSDPNGFLGVIHPMVWEKLQKGMTLDLTQPEQLAKALCRFPSADWSTILANVPADVYDKLIPLLERKTMIENFFGINLVENCMELSTNFSVMFATMWPGVIIPVLTMVTTFLSSYIMNKQAKAADPNQAAQQKMMLYMMPVMMGFMTAGFPAGVGIYWITSSVFQVAQQILLHKYFTKKKAAAADVPAIIDEKKSGSGVLGKFKKGRK